MIYRVNLLVSRETLDTYSLSSLLFALIITGPFHYTLFRLSLFLWPTHPLHQADIR
jgi:hypothetical protein